MANSKKDSGAELLELLAARNGCSYISDLKCEPFRSIALGRLYRIPKGDYTEKEWQDALDYLSPSVPRTIPFPKTSGSDGKH